jgi:hypothetical protein
LLNTAVVKFDPADLRAGPAKTLCDLLACQARAFTQPP